VAPEIYASADAFVRAWERLDTIGNPAHGIRASQCSELVAVTSFRTGVGTAPGTGTAGGSTPEPTAGTPTGTIPDVTRLGIKIAASALERAGYYVGTIEKRYEPNLPPETVIEQTPAPGTPLARGAKVAIVIAVNGAPPGKTVSGGSQKPPVAPPAPRPSTKEPPPQPQGSKQVEPAPKASPAPKTSPAPKAPPASQTRVPDLVKLDEKKAIDLLRKAGFTSGRIERHFLPNFPEGTVVEQHPAAGTMASAGAHVDLVVSTKSKP
jgi:beta-lactam-binding protein with PASTA domain